MGARDLSQNIIQDLMKTDLTTVVGYGSGISLAIAAVDISRNIANVNIQSISLDYIHLTSTYAPEAIFIELSKNPPVPMPLVEEFERQSHEEVFARTIAVGREDRVEMITNQILWRLNRFDKIRIMASGYAMMIAIKSSLQVTASGIAKGPVGISGVTIGSIERKIQVESNKRIPAIQIYLEKGKQTEYPPNHKANIDQIIAR